MAQRRLRDRGGCPGRCADMFRAMAALVTTVVGSYPQPDWLIDRERLGSRLPPRVRAHELWRIAEAHLEEAQDDATRLAVSDMDLDPHLTMPRLAHRSLDEAKDLRPTGM